MDFCVFDRQHGKQEQHVLFFGGSSFSELIVDNVGMDDSKEDSRTSGALL
jgi:hypothetical protein